ncbi:hypothetical protein LTR04_005417 [Oleoguttula sp. CCFEE 6159]|nr:hypothetical protein LTR04_005417 [Oleoguttula sp. CCFEE 6159]
MADAVSIEETNKIRVALGMKPLPVPGAPSGPVFKEAKDSDALSDEDDLSTLDKRQAKGFENWRRLQDEAEAKEKQQAKKEAIKKARDAAQRFSKLKGKGLGDVDEGEELDTKTWLMQQKRRQKKLEKARRLEQELAEREQQVEYTAADLAGVKVGHELNQFTDGDEQILTLRDTAVDDEEEGDELENLDLREKEKLSERLELKKKKPVYNPNDEDEGGSRTLLAQYDEEIDGKQRKRFTLDGHGRTAEEANAAAHGVSSKPRGMQISLDILEDDTPISDYLDPSTTKMRKPKRGRKEKTKRQKVADEDAMFSVVEAAPQSPTIDSGVIEIDVQPTQAAPVNPKKHTLDVFDDDDLQAQLAAQRRQALKKRKKMRPEDVARQMRQEGSATPGAIESIETLEGEEPGLVIDETSEFVANLQMPVESDLPPKPKNRKPSVNAASPTTDVEGDVEMANTYNGVEDEEELLARIKRDESTPAADITATGLEEEDTLLRGMGGTLAMLRKRDLITDHASDDLSEKHRGRARFLAEKARLENEYENRARVQREADRKSGKLDKMSAREREEQAQYNNTQRERIVARQLAEIYARDYKPDVKLKYVDEFGRSMNQKEAFKQMSHQFHGKGSGKQKTEKRLKKIEDEKRRDAKSTLDSSQSTGMSGVAGETARKNRQAGVRLQ